MNARYHASREAYLDTVHRWFMFAIVVLGAVAVIDVVPRTAIASHTQTWMKELFAAGAAIIAALDLTFDLSNRARFHSMMRRRYFEWLADMAAKEKTAAQVRVCINRCSADEEPAYFAALYLAWNAAQETVYGDDALRYHVPLWHRCIKNLWRFAGTRFELEKSADASGASTGSPSLPATAPAG